MSIKNRYEIKLYLECKYANPNGDPDMGNQTRTIAETMIGYMTDGAIKRRIRDYVDLYHSGEPGMNIMVQSNTNINRKIAEVKEAAGITLGDESKQAIDSARLKACELFWDVRTFGAVMNTGPNAGQVCGPVQVAFAHSLDPVQPMDISITRVAAAKDPKKKPKTAADYIADELAAKADELRTMGRKQFIPFGLYEIVATVSPARAKGTGFSDEDFMVLVKALANMFDVTRTASKGLMSVVSPVIIFKHVGDPSQPVEQQERQAMLGRAKAHKLFELVSCAKKPEVEVPESYKDYDCSVAMSRKPDGVEIGFLAPFTDEIVWGNLPKGEEWVSLS